MTATETALLPLGWPARPLLSRLFQVAGPQGAAIAIGVLNLPIAQAFLSRHCFEKSALPEALPPLECFRTQARGLFS